MRAAPDRVFLHIGHFENLPRYAAPLWMTADAVEKRRNIQVVALTGYLIGLPIESVQRVVLRPPYAVEFKQVRGTLRTFNGQCSLVGVEDGTEVRYRLEVDPGIAMISDDAARQFLVQFAERFLNRIKLAAERKTPLPRPASATGVGVAPADEEEDKEIVAAAVQDGAETETPDTPEASEDERPGAGAPYGESPSERGGAPAAQGGPAVGVPPAAAQGAQTASPVGAHPAGSAPPTPPGPSGRRRRRRHRRRGRSHGKGERGGPGGPPPLKSP